jgi:hypothetical protein
MKAFMRMLKGDEMIMDVEEIREERNAINDQSFVFLPWSSHPNAWLVVEGREPTRSGRRRNRKGGDSTFD